MIGYHKRPAYGEDEAIDTVTKDPFGFIKRIQDIGDSLPSIFTTDLLTVATDVFVTDSLWNGEGKQFTMVAFPTKDTVNLMQHEYFVRISNYSREMKKYKYSTMTAGGNMFVEPYRVYTNIEGGLGVFASKSEVMYKAILKEDENTDNR